MHGKNFGSWKFFYLNWKFGHDFMAPPFAIMANESERFLNESTTFSVVPATVLWFKSEQSFLHTLAI